MLRSIPEILLNSTIKWILLRSNLALYLNTNKLLPAKHFLDPTLRGAMVIDNLGAHKEEGKGAG